MTNRTCDAVKADMREIDEQITFLHKKRKILKSELSDIKVAAMRIIEVPWNIYRDLVLEKKITWKNLRIKDVYKYRDHCGTDMCWYKGNLDRLDHMHMFTLHDLKYNEVFICDMCLENGYERHVLPEDFMEEIEIDLNRFSAEDQKHFLKHEIKRYW